MTNLRQAAQQALEALENDAMQRTYAGGVRITNAAIALRAALAEPEQEPVAHLWQHGETGRTRIIGNDEVWTASNQWFCVGPLYLGFAPTPRKPQTTHWEGCEAVHPECRATPRNWVGLTDEEIDVGLCRSPYALQTAQAWRDGVEWAQEQLKEKNT